jgi:Transcription factor WhiB
VSHYLRISSPPDSHVRPGGWRDHALCRDHPTLPPSTWDDSLGTVDERHEHPAQRAARVARAVAVCERCPVRMACLADVDLRYDEGVRAGVDLRQLRAWKGRRP